jgi:uncharacterized protein YndB with AHSA1/START domain
MPTRDEAPEMSRTIVVDYDLPQSPEQVWRVLTEPALLAQWLMPNDLKPVVGHHFTFQAKPVPGWDGVVHCEVLEVDAPRRLRYSWCGGSKELEGFGHRLETVVSWTLTSVGSGTRLHLEHAGFGPADEFAYQGLGGGWRGKVGESLARVLGAVG